MKTGFLRKGGLPIKKNDIIYIGILLLVGVAALIGIRWYEASQRTGEAFAKVFYKDEMILQINLHTCEYIVYDTPYADQIIVQYASEGFFYVPGTTTTHVDPEDENVDVPLVKLAVDTGAGSIEVVYQESPRDICELQGASDSSLQPIVCLPNELVITVITDDTGEYFVPDGELS
jgi:hypothetical protein